MKTAYREYQSWYNCSQCSYLVGKRLVDNTLLWLLSCVDNSSLQCNSVTTLILAYLSYVLKIVTKSRSHWPKAKLTSSGKFRNYKCDVFTKKIGIKCAIFLYRYIKMAKIGVVTCDTIALNRRIVLCRQLFCVAAVWTYEDSVKERLYLHLPGMAPYSMIIWWIHLNTLCVVIKIWKSKVCFITL